MFQDQDETILTEFEETLSRSALSSSTIVNYLADVRAFLRWSKTELGDGFTLDQITQEHIRLYRFHLTQELNRAVSTANRHLMALKKFFTFTKDIGIISLNPTSGVALVQTDGQANSRPLSPEEIKKLLNAVENNGSRAGLIRRDTAILQLLLHTGLRVSELIDLQKQDLLFENPGVCLKVSNGDADKTRYLPLCSTVSKAINQYLELRPQTANNHLFLNQQGNPVSDRTVQRVIGDCAKAAKLEGISAQSLRRTFAMQLLLETNDLQLVSERLGHQNSTITAQYLAVHNHQPELEVGTKTTF
jgi:integrase/recombinase XerC